MVNKGFFCPAEHLDGFGYAKVGLDISLEVDTTKNHCALHKEQEFALGARVQEGEGDNDLREPGENKHRNKPASVLLSSCMGVN